MDLPTLLLLDFQFTANLPPYYPRYRHNFRHRMGSSLHLQCILHTQLFFYWIYVHFPFYPNQKIMLFLLYYTGHLSTPSAITELLPLGNSFLLKTFPLRRDPLTLYPLKINSVSFSLPFSLYFLGRYFIIYLHFLHFLLLILFILLINLII